MKLELGPVSGKAGEKTIVKARPGVHFNANQLVATDSGEPPGLHTRVSISIAGKAQRPFTPALTAFFSTQALRSVAWDVCAPDGEISIEIEFLSACTWGGYVEGEDLST